MKFNKVSKIAGMMALILTLAPMTVSMASVTSDDQVSIGLDSSGYYFGHIQFNPSHKVQSGEGFSLKAGKYVKQAYVRVQSDGNTAYINATPPGALTPQFLPVKICSSYDSGRCYTTKATSKVNKIYYKKESVKDCKTCTQHVNYGWLYF